MTSSVLEYIRGSREDLESIDKAISLLLQEKTTTKTPARQVSCDTCISYLITQSQKKAKEVEDLLEDKDGMKKEEVDQLAGVRVGKPQDVWMNFYDKVKESKDYHRKHGNIGRREVRSPAWFYERALEQDNSEQVFSLEEDYGKRVDMHRCYQTFLNLKKLRKHQIGLYREKERARIRSKLKTKEDKNPKVPDDHPELVEAMTKFDATRMGYTEWLKTFDQFENIPRHMKFKDADYRNYLTEVLDYLISLFERSMPLKNKERVENHIQKDFDEAWSSNSVAAMQKMTLEEQKALVEQCIEEDRQLALLEFRIEKYRDLCKDQILDTIRHCEKKETMTAEELEAEAEEAAASDSESEGGMVVSDLENEAEDDEDRPIYNPLNLPLGWDGKPIPFWLYKLHGLGQEFKCEICGNYSYWGRKSFEKHFSEWRHAYGMRCLKIPNTSHFKEITKIEDAAILYEKLKRDAKDQTFDPEADVECEDLQGNVMSQKAFDDLRRQGLV
jgi:hypothetical protein